MIFGRRCEGKKPRDREPVRGSAITQERGEDNLAYRKLQAAGASLKAE